MLRVVSVLHFPEFGGPHNQSLRLARPLANVGVESISILPPGPGADRLTEEGVEIQTINLGRMRAVTNIRVQAETTVRFPIDVVQLGKAFRSLQPDVVQLNGLINPHAAIAARSLGIPVVWQLLDTRPSLNVRRAAMLPVRALADVVMPIGHAVETAHPGASSFGDRSVIFYPPVNTDLFQRAGQSTLRDELGISADNPIVGVVGNINPQKGHEYLIEAFGIVRRTVPNARLVLAGHAYEQYRDYLETLKEIARQYNLVEDVDYFFLGSRDDVPNVLAGFDLFAFSPVPRSEGTSTAVVEALSMGVPVVTTKVASLPEVIVEGTTGFLVEPENAPALAEAISFLLLNSAKRKEMGEAAAVDVRARFSLDQCVAAHLEAFDKATNHRHGAKRK